MKAFSLYTCNCNRKLIYISIHENFLKLSIINIDKKMLKNRKNGLMFMSLLKSQANDFNFSYDLRLIIDRFHYRVYKRNNLNQY